MKNKITAILVLLVVATLVMQCCKPGESNSDLASTGDGNSITLTESQRTIAGIELNIPVKKEIKRVIKANGMLDVPPQSQVTISAPMGGFVRSTHLLQGMRVKRGEMLVELYHQDFIQLQQDYLNTLNQYEFLKAEYERQLELSVESINAQKTLQRAKADFKTAEVTLQALKARLQLLNISTEQLVEKGIRNTIHLYAPINGFVTEVNVNPGKFVNPSDVLFKLINPEHLHVELYVFEKDLPSLRIGQKVTFSLVNESNVREATIYLIGKEISPERTVRIHCHMEKDYPELIPGLYLKAFIETSKHPATVLPEEAVLTIGNEHFVFITTDQTVFHLVEIQAGTSDTGAVEILPPTQFTDSTRVVIKGAYTLLSMLKNIED